MHYPFLNYCYQLWIKKTPGIENDRRAPFYTEVQKYTHSYAVDSGRSGVYGHVV